MLDAYSRGGLDYQYCHYGSSRLLFRGPAAKTEGPYVAALGGSTTFGKFVTQPWPVLLEKVTGLRTVNLGCMHAGATAFVDDPTLISICSHARATVLQITGAHCLDNSYYSLHPRRNDRFIDATTKLGSMPLPWTMLRPIASKNPGPTLFTYGPPRWWRGMESRPGTRGCPMPMLDLKGTV